MMETETVGAKDRGRQLLLRPSLAMTHISLVTNDLRDLPISFSYRARAPSGSGASQMIGLPSLSNFRASKSSG